MSKTNKESFTCHDIPQQEQKQDALNDQLRELVIAGNRLGLYDAVDVIQRQILDKGVR